MTSSILFESATQKAINKINILGLNLNPVIELEILKPY
jgi:hypothetical protein